MALALIFPGQGSQSVGMMNSFGDSPILKDTFTQASDILHIPFWQLAQEGPPERLAQTQITQPLMLTASVALWRLWQDQGAKAPDFVAGHSLGEYSALVASGALSFEEALPLVHFRAQVMQESVPENVGCMAAIMGLEENALIEICAQAAQNEIVEAVNFNAHGQIVIAGHTQAVERAMELAKKNGAKLCKKLAVSAPFHSSLMQNAAEKLKDYLTHVPLQTPKIALVNNVDVAVELDVEKIRNALYRQAFRPVQWVKTMEFLEQSGVQDVVECGPGKVLTGLVKRCVKNIRAHAFSIELAKGI